MTATNPPSPSIPPSDEAEIVSVVRDYADFLTTTLTPRLRELVKERDDIREQIRGLEEVR